VATASLSVFLTFGLRLIFFFGFFAGETFFLGFGFSSSSSLSSGADPSYFSALLSMV
jgi:hypothetical protein